jgi:hypothetical protein
VENRSWHRIAPPEGAQLEALLDFAAARRTHYPSFLLVSRRPRDGGAHAGGPADELLAALEPELITTAETDHWPGTRLDGSTALVRFYRVERRSTQLLSRVGSLAAFVPPLPEDLCILGSDKTPWLVSATRAGRFQLHLTAEEQRAVEKTLPWLVLQPE